MIKTDNKLSAYYMQGTVLDAESELVTAFLVKLIRVVPACWICKFGQNSIHLDPCTKSLQLKWLVRGNGKYSKTFQFFPLELSSIWTEHLMPSLVDSGFQKVGKTHHHPLVLTEHFQPKCSSSSTLLRRSYSLAVAGRVETLEILSCRWGSVFKGSNSACFADEVLQEIMVHFCKARSLCYYSQMVYAKPEAEFF